MRTPKPFGMVDRVARADYAINGGTSHIFALPGPRSLQEGDTESYWRNRPNANKFSGISHLRRSTNIAGITDGASRTYLVGEKQLNIADYSTGESPGDNESLYSGYCSDLHRFAGAIERLKFQRSPFVAPLPDSAPNNIDMPNYVRFGSAHSAGFYMAYCDGAVRLVEFSVDPEIHFRSAHRRDRGESMSKLQE
jgi:hypothetical protein